MKILINFIIATFLFAGTTSAQKIGDQFFNDTHTFLQKTVKNGMVNYGSAKNDAALQQLISTISKADLSSASDATKQAFYINAYNLTVINNVAMSYPLKSVMDISGFFDSKKNSIAGKSITLNQLEKEYLIKAYGDARYHFVLVCGAVGCPPITNFAYTPAKLEQQLEMQTKKALNDSNFIKVSGNNASLSQIFNWYKGDFGGSQESVIKYISKYRDGLSSSTAIDYYEYDWILNDTASM